MEFQSMELSYHLGRTALYYSELPSKIFDIYHKEGFHIIYVLDRNM